ncbi:MAG TPA: leucyl/phenylalanyl-tRNA--protein transferase [Burkholderiales bacterium]|jgi:leucyl/phenylalanyl-tRNA--protein transferase|nr:leucyl/phenylalanyl-tRNA--protein transferase [Burkholderiales bacterium]
MIPWLGKTLTFPPLTRALQEPNGLLAAGGDLTPERLIAAYTRGIFPWYSAPQPILWWSPDPRMVLFPAEFTLRRSLAKVLRNRDYEVRCDTAFERVMRACAATPREGQDGTWITEEILAGYCALHRQGVAHSIETWIDGKLVGGLYGVALGRVFYGESMFAHATDASKIAFSHLVHFLHARGCGIIDCQMRTEHLASLGAREIPRPEFAARLADLTQQPAMQGWGEIARAWFPDGHAQHHVTEGA